MRASDFNFKAGSCSNDRWLLARTGCVSIEIEGLGKNAFSIGRFGHVLFAADEFANFCCSGGAVVGEFSVSQSDTPRCAGNEIKLMS